MLPEGSAASPLLSVTKKVLMVWPLQIASGNIAAAAKLSAAMNSVRRFVISSLPDFGRISFYRRLERCCHDLPQARLKKVSRTLKNGQVHGFQRGRAGGVRSHGASLDFCRIRVR